MRSQSTELPVRKRPLRWRTARTVFALMLREMATSYGRNPGGYLWAVLEPVAAITLLTLVFSVAFRTPPLGNSFAMFYAAGYLPFMIYVDVAQKLTASLRFSRPLLVYPAVTFTDALLARFLLNYVTHIVVFLIVMTGIVISDDVNIILDPGAVFRAFAMVAALALGIGTCNCFLISRYPLWERLWAILNRPLFIISGIFFTFESVPEPYRDWLWFNPLVHIIGSMRAGVFSTYDATYVSPLYVFGLSMVLCVLGLIFLGRYHRDILNDM